MHRNALFCTNMHISGFTHKPAPNCTNVHYHAQHAQMSQCLYHRNLEVTKQLNV